MNRGSKLTLPVLNPFTDRQDSKSKRKFFKAWPVNDTFSNWKIHTKNTQPCTLTEVSTSDLMPSDTPSTNGGSRSQLVSGMTLGDYFRSRSNTEAQENNEYQDVTDEEILPYLKENFDIHETDEDNYSESDTSIRVPQKLKTKEQQQYLGHIQPVKMKTESDEPSARQSYGLPPTLKKKGSIVNKSRDRILHMQQSFDMKPKSKSRNQQDPFRKVKQELVKKQCQLERGRDRNRASELKNYNVDLVVKYANKFSLNEKIYVDTLKVIQ